MGRSANGKGFGCRPGASGGPGKRAGVRKPPKKEPAGKRQDLAVYGDLARQRVCRGMVFLGSLRAESR